MFGWVFLKFTLLKVAEAAAGELAWRAALPGLAGCGQQPLAELSDDLQPPVLRCLFVLSCAGPLGCALWAAARTDEAGC